MSTWNNGSKTRSLLLLTEAAEVANRIGTALASYQLVDSLAWYHSLDDLHKAALHDDLSSNKTVHFDLCLLAYQSEDMQRQTVINIRQLRDWDLVPVVAFLPKSHGHTARQLYQLGSNSVLSYPPNFDSLRELVKVIDSYWFDVVSLPEQTREP